jgi:hypothetical protein
MSANCRKCGGSSSVGVQKPATLYSAAVQWSPDSEKFVAGARERFHIRTLRLDRIVEAGNGFRVYPEEYAELIAAGAPVYVP